MARFTIHAPLTDHTRRRGRPASTSPDRSTRNVRLHAQQPGLIADHHGLVHGRPATASGAIGFVAAAKYSVSFSPHDKKGNATSQGHPRGDTSPTKRSRGRGPSRIQFRVRHSTPITQTIHGPPKPDAVSAVELPRAAATRNKNCNMP